MSFHQYHRSQTNYSSSPNKMRCNKLKCYVSNAVNRDADIAKQKEKIKYLKEKLSSQSTQQSYHCDNNNIDRVMSQNRLIHQKCQLYEEKIIALESDNRRLNMIINEKNEVINQYEIVIRDSKLKLIQLNEMNDNFRETIENTNNNNASKVYNNNRLYCDSNSFTLHTQNNNTNNIKISNKTTNKDNSQNVIQETRRIKSQLRKIESIFNDQLHEKDKKIEALGKENNRLINDIDHISKDKENILAEQNSRNHIGKELLSMKTILKDINNKSNFYDDIYHSSLQRLNRTIVNQNKLISDLNQKVGKSSYNESNAKYPIKTRQKLTYAMNI